MNIIGINAYHGDSSACLVMDGRLIAAVEEERFRRIKHWAGFPSESIKYCLEASNLKIDQIDHIAINRNPNTNLIKKALFAVSNNTSLGVIRDRMRNAGRIMDIRRSLTDMPGISGSTVKAKVHNVEHHRAHLASAFFVSVFDLAALVSVDGFGDFVSMMWGVGKSNKIQIRDQVNFPHSLGLFYLAMTQYLGFPKYGDEYKAMGLSAYGKPTELKKIRKLVRLKNNGKFELDLRYFLHHAEGVSMSWEGGEPHIGRVYSDKLLELLGPARRLEEPMNEYYQNVAASMQTMYEEAFFHILNYVHTRTKETNLCLAGGCALNSVANGKIFENTPFKELYIQAAAGDAGGAIGAAYYVWNHILGNKRSFVMDHAYWGAEYAEEEIASLLSAKAEDLKRQECVAEKIEDEDGLCQKTAQAIAEGKVVGWFQGRMEWGPRALGNRSIVCDPRRADMKEILNLKIKRRESFRPFAPSILREKVKDWFETDYDVPFMLQVYQIKKEKRSAIPAVTHVNGSGRLQTIEEKQNPIYYKLIRKFELISNVPILLNTSFNENEPIVCKPDEALDCFLRTKMDVLVMGNYFVNRKSI